MKKYHPLDPTVWLQNPHYTNHHPTNTFVLGHILLAIPVKHVCLPAKRTITPCKSASQGGLLKCSSVNTSSWPHRFCQRCSIVPTDR